MFKLVLVFAFIQAISSQCICNENNWSGIVSPRPLSWSGVQPCNGPYDHPSIHPSPVPPSGFGLEVTSSSPIAPGVLSITSENVIQGPISVYGQLPFVSAVSFEGPMRTGGYGGVAYRAGDGNIGIISETGLELPSAESEISTIRPFDIQSFRSGLGILPGRPEVSALRTGCGCVRPAFF